MPSHLSFARTVFLSLSLAAGLTSSQFAHAADKTLDVFERQMLTDVYFSEGAGAGDINGDGNPDVVYGPHWYAGPDFTKKNEIFPAVPQPRERYADHFFSWVHDFDGDGHRDVLTAGFPGTPGFVYRNPGPDQLDTLWEKIEVADQVSNEAPQFADITADGVPELICTRNGNYGYYLPTAEGPLKPWTFISISEPTAPTPFGHGLGVGDVNGDGRPDMLAREGWFEQPEVVKSGENWKFHAFEFARASADMFAYDVDGDGDQDIITSLSAHDFGLAWFENTGKNDAGEIEFTRHLLMGDKVEDSPYGLLFTELHAVQLADVNGDGLLDIITGKTYWSHHTQSPMWDAGAVVYWFELRRTITDEGDSKSVEVDFVPHLADGEAGIGRGLAVADINNDGLVDIITGGMKGGHVLTHVRKTVSDAEWEEAQPRKQVAMAEGLEPVAAAANMTVPPGFKVQLAAGEPMVHQPVAMCFDHKGRLWVAEAHTYPLRAVEGEGKDKIVIFEDQDHDGTFDHSKVFIEGLNLVSGLEVGFGGVYVGAAPYLMFIPDRDGDDKPDAPVPGSAKTTAIGLQFPGDVPPGAVVLRDGFGWQDTHETLNAFIWGPDGWLYGCHGVFTHSKVGKPGAADDQRIPVNASVWRYHPVRDEFETFMNGTSNPWGVDFNDRGQAFITACVIPHLWHVIQGGRYHRQGGQHFNAYTYEDIKTIADHAHYVGDIRDHAWWGHEPRAAGGTSEAGGGHAHCGAMIYLGDNWPDQYRNQIFFNNVHGNRVNCDILEPVEGTSAFVGHHGKDLLMANDHYFRGINLRYGPDGTVYLIDWYDKNACHRTNPEIWDRTSGRIYRISYGDVKTTSVDLSTWTDAQLVAAHDHRNEWYVRTARRILMDRGTSPELLKSLADAVTDHSRPVELRLRYLWTLHAVGGLTDSMSEKLLSDDQEYIRAWTVQLTTEDSHVSPSMLSQFVKRAAADSSAVVRLYLTSAIQRLPLSQRWALVEALAARAEDAEDHNIPLILWYGAEPLVPADTARAMKLAESTKIPSLRRFLIRRAAAGNETIAPVIELLGQVQGAENQELILDEMLRSFEGRVGIPMPAAWKSTYETLMKSESQAIRDKSDQIAILLGDQRVFPRMRALLADASQKPERRRQALDVLVRGQDKGAVSALLSPGVLTDAQLQAPAIRALVTLGDDSVPAALMAQYAQIAPESKQDVVSTLVSRPAWTRILLNEIGAGKVPSADLHAYHVRQIVSFNNTELNELLKKHWGEVRESSQDRQSQIKDWKNILKPKVVAAGHAGNGRRVFSKTCQNCHRLFGTGGEIGPDITGSNRANLDYILENILDPSAVVGRDYQMTVLALTDGRVVNGLLKQETDSAITIQTINDRLVIAKSDIEERALSNVSMMPERQLDSLSKDDVRDLVAYLSSPTQVAMAGPPSPIDASGKVPDALEGETLKIVEKTGGTAASQQMGGFPKDRWSGNDHLWWTGAKPGDRLGLEIPVPADGRYTVELVLTKARDYGQLKVSIGEQILETSVDCFNNPDVVTTGVLSYSGVSLKQGETPLTLEITGAHPEAVKAYMVGVDFVRLVPEAAEASVK
ncbi:MAG: VCBS repeat-containing protein [Planctomyces sp.]|nr:VCBS repeat-containing protein [Planctomyces sp.]